MKLSKIIQNMECNEIINFKDLNVECLAHNSMDVIENSIFFCITGGTKKGEDYVEDAVNRGAKVIVAQRRLDVDCVVIVVSDVRIAMSIMAKNFYNKADEKLTKVALIGTNGKTTTSFIIENILRAGKKKVGVIGTNGIYINGEYLPSNLTTPDPIELHYIFSQMLAFGVEVVVMEVSAHAIFYNKIYGIKFDIGVFTNITQEHLDFFHTMDEYAKVKMSIFDKRYMNECVINIDNEYGVQIAKQANILAVSYGIYNPANVFAVDIKMSINGSNFFVNINDEVVEIKTKLVGEYNIYNILAGISVAKLLGINAKTIVRALKNMEQVAGRFNMFDLEDNKKIIVDFAHTPDGFEQVLSLIAKLRRGKLTTIFGCVGYSDKAKRKSMGEIASKYSNKIIITTDNVGETDFDEIVIDIKSGICKDVEVVVEADREKAINMAYKSMHANETLAILGKGAETKQVVKGKNIEYSDLKVIESLIQGGISG